MIDAVIDAMIDAPRRCPEISKRAMNRGHILRTVGEPMKAIQTTRARQREFAVLHCTRSSQAATMTLAPGGESSESSSNEHAWAEQWLYVVSGTGTARIGHRSVKLQPGSLVLIEKHEPHVIRAGKRNRLVTVNVYVPPAYSGDGEPLKRRRAS
jgi:mannose-6-phosphate isomerase-like protein (cupin superfamily)